MAYTACPVPYNHLCTPKNLSQEVQEKFLWEKKVRCLQSSKKAVPGTIQSLCLRWILPGSVCSEDDIYDRHLPGTRHVA